MAVCVADEGLEEAEGHLGPAGVVGAQEQHGGFAVVVQAFDLGEGGEPLPAERFGPQGRNLVMVAVWASWS
jgi:hypothetical protein